MRRPSRRRTGSPAWPFGRTARIRVALAIGLVIVLGVALGGGVAIYRAGHVVLPLYGAGVAIGPDGEPIMLAAGAPLGEVFPGTRVLKSSTPQSAALAAGQRAWLAAGTVPGTNGAVRNMVADALLDLHALTLPAGAPVASWATPWRYVWPRDDSFAAVALQKTGHGDDALNILKFLQHVQPADGVFQARYRPDGSGVPDARGPETDETGWALWAAQQVVGDRSGPDRTAVLTALRPLIDTSSAAVLALTDRPGALPAASLDYWEIKDHRLSLGTAAPLALGLRAAADLQSQLGATALATQLQQRAGELEASIRTRFGPDDYPRYLGAGAPDASLAFLLPPFTTTAQPSVLAAWRVAETKMRRPAGGFAPGADWGGGVSWTPPTALFAWTSASLGDPASARQAQQGLEWLAGHATSYGALPEKVLSNGKPAGPAPLGWTDALTVLTAVTLAPTSPVRPG